MERIEPNLEEEFPDFLPLIEEASYWKLEGIPQFRLDNYGLPTPAIAYIQYQAMALGFKKYLLKINGIENVKTEEEALKYWNPSFFTLKNLIGWIADERKEQIEIKANYEEGVRSLNSVLIEALPKKNSIEDFNNEEKGLYLYFSGDKPRRDKGAIYNRFNFYQKEENRKFKSAKQAKPLINRFEIIIPFISNPEKMEIAKNELDELKIAYYEDTGIKIE